MSLKIMIAGCPKEERDSVEASVRQAMTGVDVSGGWNVSLVNVANQWSIDIDGPEPQFKGLSVSPTSHELVTSLQQALNDARGAAAGATPATATPTGVSAGAPAPAGGPNGVRQNRHECEACAAAFDVVFDANEGEPEELCPVACPACWHVNKVPVAEAAGSTGDYRAQAVA